MWPCVAARRPGRRSAITGPLAIPPRLECVCRWPRCSCCALPDSCGSRRRDTLCPHRALQIGQRMSATDVDRFRITTWPGVVLPVPPVMKGPVELNRDYLVYGRPLAESTLAEELAIRGLLVVDL